jgi:Spy/CpxP family protein refolding chaperone
MARHFGWAVAALLVFGGAALSADLGRQQAQPQRQQAQPQKDQQQKSDGRDRRGWWHDKRVVAELALTSDQVDRLERIFVKHTEKAVPLRKEVQDMEKALDQAIRTQKLDVPAFAAEVDRIENKRAELNKMRAVMLYRLRLVLNTEQNSKFQAMLDRRDNDRRRDDRRH